jgi:outer membrane immunogenic protein
VAAIASIAITTPAFAADMPVPIGTAPPAYVWVETSPPIYNWTGCYLGVQGGAADGQSRHVAATPPNPADAGLPLTNYFDLTGGLIGGAVGCNYQAANIVFGIEDDFSSTNLKGTGNEIPPFSPAATASTNESWLDTLRGRVGFAKDRFLVYATGGAAFANIGVDVCAPPAGCTSVSQTQVGWVAGVGGEWAALVDDGWSVTFKVEYQFADFGTDRFVSPPEGNFSSRNVSLSENIVRVGMNLKFNSWDTSLLNARY